MKQTPNAFSFRKKKKSTLNYDRNSTSLFITTNNTTLVRDIIYEALSSNKDLTNAFKENGDFSSHNLVNGVLLVLQHYVGKSIPQTTFTKLDNFCEKRLNESLPDIISKRGILSEEIGKFVSDEMAIAANEFFCFIQRIPIYAIDPFDLPSIAKRIGYLLLHQCELQSILTYFNLLPTDQLCVKVMSRVIAMFDARVAEEPWGDIGRLAVEEIIKDGGVMSERIVRTITQVIAVNEQIEISDWIHNRVLELISLQERTAAERIVNTFLQETLEVYLDRIIEELSIELNFTEENFNILLAIDPIHQYKDVAEWIIFKKNDCVELNKMAQLYGLNCDEVRETFKQKAKELENIIGNMLCADNILQLFKWIGTLNAKVTYEATKDGWEYPSFIEKCHNKQLVFIVKTQSNDVFGGIVTEPFDEIQNNSRHDIIDNNTFLFVKQDKELVRFNQCIPGVSFSLFNNYFNNALFMFANGFIVRQPPESSLITFPDVLVNEDFRSYCSYEDQSGRGISLFSTTQSFVAKEVIALSF
ncbi:hypothetical protein QTN25_003474 [Entamoeba marina]